MSELNEKNKNNELNDQDLDEVSGGMVNPNLTNASNFPFTRPDINSVAPQPGQGARVNKKWEEKA